MKTYSDHFSRDSAAYAKFRPRYPAGLMVWLATLPARREVAWDCGTGSGQAAVLLAPHFGRVLASDASRAQVRSATPQAGVHYFAARAEASAIRAARVDLVTVAQALHWIDLDRFYSEIDRVLAPDGAVAVWSYGILRSTPQIDRVIHRFYKETVGPYWPSERIHVEEGYRRFEIPIEEVPTPPFEIEADLTLAQLLGYVRTWSAVGRYVSERDEDPVTALEDELAPFWGDPGAPRRILWPLTIRAGRWRGTRTPARGRA